MLGEMHDILHEFPNMEQTIKDLHDNDPDFSRLMDEHDALDSEIRKLEELAQPISDEHMEELKFKRAALKDRIYDILRQAQKA
ncbi:MAG TPA: DUF465 domain-containing protein [Sedimenticola thiotaurini]|uniref:DUF465 domain-containing protein n=1 Tax=Sedimenticola thiotaurini TaxID=1543721 RepID=A0A831RPH3_9GAMM|nr:DUF465 domain-containing protein [Sedimenticola thiotaurini]